MKGPFSCSLDSCTVLFCGIIIAVKSFIITSNSCCCETWSFGNGLLCPCMCFLKTETFYLPWLLPWLCVFACLVFCPAPEAKEGCISIKLTLYSLESLYYTEDTNLISSSFIFFISTASVFLIIIQFNFCLNFI